LFFTPSVKASSSDPRASPVDPIGSGRGFLYREIDRATIVAGGTGEPP
jgi:hypothetical protein